MKRRVLGLSMVLVLGCGPGKKTEVAPTPAKAESSTAGPTRAEKWPELRTGSASPQRQQVEAEVLAWETVDGAEYLRLAIDAAALERAQGEWPMQFLGHELASGQLLATRNYRDGDKHELWLRRRQGADPTEARTSLHLLYHHRPEGRVGRIVDIRAPLSGTPKAGESLRQQWATVYSEWMMQVADPFWQFAGGRLLRMAAGGKGRELPDTARRPDDNQGLEALMATTTGAAALQEALQYERGLRVEPQRGPLQPISRLQGPALVAHPFAEMRALLPKTSPAPEPLAALAPHDFWYLRFHDLRDLLALQDLANEWLTPAAGVLEGRPTDAQLSDRYQRQLGVRRSDLARLFGDKVVGDVALVGSDPYLRIGSDVTLMMQLESELVVAELDRHLQHYRDELPELTSRSQRYKGVQIDIHSDPTGSVRQHRARIGDVVVLSNSLGAMRAVIDAKSGRRRALADSEDFRFFRARDVKDRAGYVFISDAFVARVIGPEQKILDARRQLALAELLVPGYSAMLFGWLEGRAPARVEEIVARGVMEKSELRHENGDPIAFDLEIGAQSRWGRASAMTPLIDLPVPARVTKAEAEAYRTFSEGYQRNWDRFIDPIGVGIELRRQNGELEVAFDVRVMPLIEDSDYKRLAAVDSPLLGFTLGDGLGAGWSLSPSTKASLQDLLSWVGMGGSKPWLGDWIEIGLRDEVGLLHVLAAGLDRIQPTAADESALIIALDELPFYVAVGLEDSAVFSQLFEKTVASLKESSRTQIVDTKERIEGVPIMEVRFAERSVDHELGIHYAVTDKYFVLGLNRSAVVETLKRYARGGAPTPSDVGKQLAMNIETEPDQPLGTAMSWTLQRDAVQGQDNARQRALALLFADPALRSDTGRFVSRARAYLGGVPVNSVGLPEFVFSPEGVGDAHIGSSLAPSYPRLPIETSPIRALVERFRGLRFGLRHGAEAAPAGITASSLELSFALKIRE